jgi:hypothetical protein
MVDAAAEVFAVDASRIATAASYYGDYDLGQDVIAVAERGELRAISGRRSIGDGSRAVYQDLRGSPAAAPSGPWPPGLLRPAPEACSCH